MFCRLIYRWGCVVALFLAVPMVLMAQEVLTLAQAIEAASVHNPDLQAERLRLNVAQSERTRAEILFPSNPEFELENASDGLVDNKGSGGYSLSISQEVEIAGQRGKRKRIADLGLNRVAFEIERFEQGVITEVTTAYYNLAFSREKLVVADTVLVLHKRVKDAAERRFKTGDISEFERNLVLAEWGKAVAERSRMQAEVQAAEVELNLLLGRSFEQRVVVRVDTTGVPGSFDLDQLLQLGFNSRRDLKARAVEEKAAKENIGLARAEGMPNPSVSFSYDLERAVTEADDFAGDPAIIGGLEGIRDRDRLFRFRVVLPLPFLNRNQAGVQAARAAAQMVDLRRKGQEQRIWMEITRAYRRYTGAEKALVVYQDMLPGVIDNAGWLVKAYDAGELDLTALLVGADRVFGTRLSYFDALFDYHKALAELELAVGTSLKNSI